MVTEQHVFSSRQALTLAAVFVVVFLVTNLMPSPWRESIEPDTVHYITINNVSQHPETSEQPYPDQSSPGSIQPARWTTPSSCPPKMRYAKGANLPKTALTSFPGSGNTWVRHLLQMATGIYTGSVYNDVGLKKNGFPGEHRQDGSVLVIKTHRQYKEPKDSMKRRYNRALLIVRNPYDCIMAEYKRQKGNKNHTSQVDEKVFTGKSWKNFRQQKAKSWISFHDNWLNHFHGPLHIISYERLKENLTAELSTALRFLGWNITSDQLECVKQNSEGLFHRRATTLHHDPYEGFNRTRLDQWFKSIKQWPRNFNVSLEN